MTDQNAPAEVDLATYVQATAAEDQQHAAQCVNEARVLVMRMVGDANPYRVPAEVISRCVLEVGAELYYRKRTRHGVASFDGIEAPAPIRIARDPMSAARPILRDYIPIGLA